MMVHYKKDKEERMQFYFCNNDIEWCVKGTRFKWMKSRPDVPNIWPMKIGINLSKKEILDMELPQRGIISLRRLFRMEALPFDHSLYPTLVSSDDHPKTKPNKNIRRNKNAPTMKHANNCAS
jgi:hypothetical protein